MTVTLEQVHERLGLVNDPDYFVSVADLGIVGEVSLDSQEEGTQVALELKRHLADRDMDQVITRCKNAVGDLEGVNQVEVSVVDFTEWTPEQMTDRAQFQLAALEALKEVIDPELFVNIVDLGLIYGIDYRDSETEGQKDVLVEMTMTSPACPAGPQLIAGSKNAVGQLEVVNDVEVRIVMTPPWTPDKMTEAAKDQLGIF